MSSTLKETLFIFSKLVKIWNISKLIIIQSRFYIFPLRNTRDKFQVYAHLPAAPFGRTTGTMDEYVYQPWAWELTNSFFIVFFPKDIDVFGR